MNHPAVSVIVPVYNSEAWLDRCIKSILSQDFHDFELMLVNDGSTDSSADICRRFQASVGDRIVVVDQPNSGASLARKAGVARSRGEYLMFVDSDDYISPHYVGALYEAVRRLNTKVSQCVVQRIQPGEHITFGRPAESVLLTQPQVFERFFNYEFWGFYGGCYHRSVFNDIIFPEATVNEDYFVKAQIFSGQPAIAFIDTALYGYEIHRGSLSHLKLSKRALGEFDNAVATYEYICANQPAFRDAALAIATEVVCKWYTAVNSHSDYPDYRQKIGRFIRRNRWKMLFSRNVLWKYKLLLAYKILRRQVLS